MKYVHPILPGRKIGPIRISSWGLGNLLFPFARAVKYADEHGLELIWPTWAQLHIGSWIRRDPDKRIYSELFKIGNRWRKSLPPRVRRFRERELEAFLAYPGDACLDVDDFMDGAFAPLIGFSNPIWKELTDISKFDINTEREKTKGTIGVHIRLGDMKQKLDWLTPPDWYAARIKEIKALRTNQRFVIYSDDPGDLLQEILTMPNVTRSPVGRPATLDIAALAGSDAVITGKASTFSRWAVYFGKNPVVALAHGEWWRKSWDGVSIYPVSLCGDETPTAKQLDTLLKQTESACQSAL